MSALDEAGAKLQREQLIYQMERVTAKAARYRALAAREKGPAAGSWRRMADEMRKDVASGLRAAFSGDRYAIAVEIDNLADYNSDD